MYPSGNVSGVFNVYLPLLTTEIAGFISNILRGACSGTTYVYLSNNSLFSILKCARDIPTVYYASCSLFEVYW